MELGELFISLGSHKIILEELIFDRKLGVAKVKVLHQKITPEELSFTHDCLVNFYHAYVSIQEIDYKNRTSSYTLELIRRKI